MAYKKRRHSPTMPLMPADKGAIREERTRPLTGDDASVDEASFGDAGNGADYWSSDLKGMQPIEDEADGDDIQPDEIRLFPRREAAQDPEVTAQPNDPVPQEPSEFP